MKEYWVDFSGYLKVKANSVDEVERKMWNFINGINVTDGLSDDVWEIEMIEEIEKHEEN